MEVTSDIPKRFRITKDSPIAKQLKINECYGLYSPDFGTYIIISEERGIDDFTGMPEDSCVEWID